MVLQDNDYSKLKDAIKVWHTNKFGNANNKLNHVWITSRSTKVWRGVNRIRRETTKSYVHSEVVELTEGDFIWNVLVRIPCFNGGWNNVNVDKGSNYPGSLFVEITPELVLWPQERSWIHTIFLIIWCGNYTLLFI